MLDIGGGTSDLALYQKGTIKHTMVLPIAGNHFTSDIAIGLHTTLKSAEEAKKEFGIVDASLIGQDECLEIEAIGQKDSRIILQSELLPILRPRAQELLKFIDKECKKHNLYPTMPSGMVLTGGGALLKGMDRIAASILGIPVRIGTPQLQSPFALFLENPMYATAYGLLLHTAKKQDTGITKFNGPLTSRIITRMKSWVSEFF
jgi:cell division protein FtsA